MAGIVGPQIRSMQEQIDALQTQINALQIQTQQTRDEMTAQEEADLEAAELAGVLMFRADRRDALEALEERIQTATAPIMQQIQTHQQSQTALQQRQTALPLVANAIIQTPAVTAMPPALHALIAEYAVE